MSNKLNLKPSTERVDVVSTKLRYCNIVFNQSVTFPENVGSHFRSHAPTTYVDSINFEYQGNKMYKYKTDLVDLVPGDLVVVTSGMYKGNAPEFKVAVFVSYDPIIPPHLKREEIRYIVDYVNTREYSERLYKEQRKKEILNELRAKKEQMEEVLLFKMLAEADPEAQELLKELDCITTK